MQAIEFDISYPTGKKAKAAFLRTYSLNAYYAGKHWAKRQKEAQDIHALTLAAMGRAGVPSRCMERVAISFFWDDGLDIDNHAVLGKMIVDAMKGYILKDDNPRHFRTVTHRFWSGGMIHVCIYPIREVDP